MRLQEWQEFIVGSRHESNIAEGWKQRYSEYLIDEYIEQAHQHGAGLPVLMLPSEFYRLSPETLGLRQHMVDEASDLAWFAIDGLDRSGYDIEDICKASTFDQFELQTEMDAPNIRVRNKLGILDPTGDPDVDFASLVVNPGYVYLRAINRLARDLNPDLPMYGGVVASDLENPQPLDATFRILFQSMSYIGRHRLGVSFETIGRFNIAKLTHRERYGKSNDLQFADFLDLNTVVMT